MFTFNQQNFHSTSVFKAFENDHSKIIDETIVYPDQNEVFNVKEGTESFADMIAISPHSQIFPKEDNYDFVIFSLLNLNYNNTYLNGPVIKIISSPLRVIKIKGMTSLFSSDDSSFESILQSLDGDLAVTSTVQFENKHASTGLWNMFNFSKLSRRDKQELAAFKMIDYKVVITNVDVKSQLVAF